ncbi:gamma-glutamylcyclotransferase family protein [Flammeovirgaceae bacterium SG7u.111]|nr:gamma-glutamylcyclotransferase family protein [Flammeovirgaceae bacterium SG7u.132]WPO38365.1 gamma-glutamylcyclotransferase family protein [Flammeovirgaceae bacterium SG7u.111]
MSSEYLFVYGTLMSDFDNGMATLLHMNAAKIGTGTVPGKMSAVMDWHFPYPMAYHIPSSSKLVKGEIYEFDDIELFDIVIREIDKYEGVKPKNDIPSDYDRVKVGVTTEDGNELECWMYVAEDLRKDQNTIASGDFNEFMKDKKK